MMEDFELNEHQDVDDEYMDILSMLSQNDSPTNQNHSAVNLPSKELSTNQKQLTEVDIFGDCDSEDEGKSGRDKSEIHTGLTDSSDDEERKHSLDASDSNRLRLSDTGRSLKSSLNQPPKKYYHNDNRNNLQSDKKNQLPKSNSSDTTATAKKETSLFGCVTIVDPLVSSFAMKDYQSGKKAIVMHTLSENSCRKLSDSGEEWVTVGVVVSKSDTKTSEKGNQYSILKLSDLKGDMTKTISCFLFGNTYKEFWKTAVGSVIALSSPQINLNNMKQDDISMSVSKTMQVLLLGTSKDFGCCRGVRKDGGNCTMIVNKSECPYCPFHVQKEYKKMQSRRKDIPVFSLGQPRGLKNQLIMYGGQCFSAGSGDDNTVRRQAKAMRSNKQNHITLGNVQLMQKAKNLTESLETGEKKGAGTELQSKGSQLSLNDNQKQFAERLLTPTAGSRNMIKHLTNVTMKEQRNSTSSSSPIIRSISARELLDMHKNHRTNRSNANSITLQTSRVTDNTIRPQNAVAANPKGSLLSLGTKPVLCAGVGANCDIDLDFNRKATTEYKSLQSNKFKAIAALKGKKLEKQDPNAIKTNFNVEKRQHEDDDSEHNSDQSKRLKGDDFSRKNLDDIINRKSKFSDDVEQETTDKYFDDMVKKEKLENKMLSTMELPCKAVTCKKCNYTALSASDLCKKEGHRLTVSSAIKRFFKCRKCNYRAISLDRTMQKSCKNCGGFDFERAAMIKEKTGPKLDSEVLLLRGNEEKFIGSVRSSGMNINL